MNLLRANWAIIIFIIIVSFFFRPFLVGGKLPIPSDAIIGLYHPFRDLYAKDYPNGIPFKNFLITDPVRQQYPWRELSIDLLKRGELPLWNPYAMAGYPLLGNQQSGHFYPLNILFFILPFSLAWSILIVLAPLMSGIFLYLYLNNLKISKWASLLGSITFAFSGFSVAWLEWGTILHVGLWLPLILLSLDKIVSSIKYQVLSIKLWSLVFLFSLSSSFFAGHLQTFFYVAVISVVYFFARWIQFGKNKKTLLLYILLNTCFIILTFVQWFPTLQLISESARDIDLDWRKEGWFIPWQHLVQFIAPDFFGNPATLNYWGVWNYGEFIGYIGIIPLLMALFAIIARRDKKTFSFAAIFILSLIFALPTLIAKLPYMLSIPFLSTAQPTRLLFITDFSLTVLAALGFDFFLRARKRLWYVMLFIGVVLVGLWLVVFMGKEPAQTENLMVANRNLRLPTILFALSVMSLFIFQFFQKKRIATLILCCTLVGIVLFDLVRFGWKFTPFTNQEYLFPQTEVTAFLQKQQGQFRIMTTDSRIFPPNFSTVYRIQSVDGYDPLYLRRYGELIAASERGRPDISPPFGFNRIITPHNFESEIIDLLGVKYVLSLSDLQSPKLTKVFQEEQTRVYENRNVLPRAFFVEEMQLVGDKKEAIQVMFSESFDPRKMAVVENTQGGESIPPLRRSHIDTFNNPETSKIIEYSENRVDIKTENDGDGFLVLTDSFYHTWGARIDGEETKIYRTDFNFRGIVIPSGSHVVEFYNTLF